MNVILNCCGEKGSAGFTIEVGGKVVHKCAYKVDLGENAKLKEYVFHAVIRGLRVARSYVNHEDLLLIGVSNQHMAEWLNGSMEYKGYETYLDEISDIIETIDCRYLFTKVDMKRTKKILEGYKVDVALTGADSIMEEFK